MHEIDIQIKKGVIKSFEVTFKDGLPEVRATIGLFSANDKEISTFSISTQNYYGMAHFELPMEMIYPIQEIANRLEKIVVIECNKQMCLLEVKKDKE